MQPRTWLAAALVLSLGAAGCIDETRESTDDEAGGNSRQFVVDVPDGATDLHVDVSGRATAGEPDVTVLLEGMDGRNLASDTFSVRETTERRVSADVSGMDRVKVTVRVVDGDAELDVKVVATVPDREPVVIVQERVVIVQVERPPPTMTTTTPPATTTPPTPPTTTTPPTNATNTTNETNATG